jgi:hypothetical protein
MEDLIRKVEDLQNKFRSDHALAENAYAEACNDVIELLQSLQQATESKDKFYCWHADATSEESCKSQCDECKKIKFNH